MTQEALKQMYQLLLKEPHAPTLCAQLERIAREALAEHAMRETQRLGQEIEQEPVAWPCLIDSADFSENTITLAMQCEDYKVSAGTHWLSITPPQRTWVGLNEDEIDYLIHLAYTGDEEFVQTIEAKLKEKNT